MRKGFAVVIALGPGEMEELRFRDLLDALRCFEPSDCVGVVLVDDGERGSEFIEKLSSYPPVFRIPNPRNGRGDPWKGGLTVGVISGLSFVQSRLTPEYVLKLDSDSLVIAPFHAELAEQFRAGERIGLLGARVHRDVPAQAGSAEYWGRQILKSTNRHSITRQPKLEIGINFGPAAASLRCLLREAYKNGYSLGETCIGGGYALRSEALHSMYRLGVLSPSLRFIKLQLTEDVFVSLATRAAGFELKDLNDSGEVFGVAWNGLPGSPAELLEQKRSVIHSVKSSEGFEEKSLRAFFRNNRLRDHRV